MIKTSVMFSAHAIHVLIRNTLIFFTILFIALFTVLNMGIHIDTFKISDYHVDGLYIKLDKKLILTAQKVTIPKSKASPSSQNIEKTFENIKYLLTFFQHIDLRKIAFDNNVLGIYYRDNILQISSNDYLIRGNIYREGDILKGNVPILELKKQNVILRGEFSYDLHKDILKTNGTFLFQKIVGHFKALKNQKKITFSLNSDTFQNLRPVIEKFHLSHTIESWILEKIQAKSYRLYLLEGKGSIEKQGIFLDKHSLEGKALLEDVDVHFKKGLYPVHAKSILLTYSAKKGFLFDLDTPTYQERDLNGSRVYIGGMETNQTTLSIDLHLFSPFDVVVQNILEAYGVTIPVDQKSGDLNGTVHIDTGLNYSYFNVKSILTLNESNLRLDKLPLHILKGKITYEKDTVHLYDIHVKEKRYEGVVEGKVYLDKKQAFLSFDAKKIAWKYKGKLLFHLKNRVLPVWIHYKKGLRITSPKLALSFQKDKKMVQVKLEDLTKVKPYLSDRYWFENGGSLEVRTQDLSTFDFKGVVKPVACFFYEDKNVCKTAIPFYGTLSEKNIQFYAFDKHLTYNALKSRVDMDTLNIDLKVLLENNILKNKKRAKEDKFIIVGKNSHLRYGTYQLILDSYDVEISPDGEIKAIGSCLGDIIKFSKKKERLSIRALRIKDKVLHPLIHFKGLQGGRYSIKIEGNPQKTMNGEIIIEGGIMRDFKAYKNTADFVKTVPSLASLEKSNTSSHGFKIKNGVIEYHVVKGKRIVFDSIYIEGVSATLIGKGELDLTQKTLDIKLAIHVARDLGKILGSVPLVGYILMGKDKSITVGLKISGTLDKPIVQNSAVTDILTSPFGLIKRTLESPNHIINQ